MSDTKASSVSMTLKPKKKLTIPTGAKEISREVRIEVEEIENGFLLEKRVEIRYQMPGKDYTDYTSCTYKHYSKTSPIKMDNQNKELADLFEG